MRFRLGQVVVYLWIRYISVPTLASATTKMNVQVDPNEDTEWNDILRAHGVIPEKPPSPTEQIEKAFEEAVERAHANRLEDRTLDELDELEEEGLEDEEFVQMYRNKRMAEIKQMASKMKFGEVHHISKPEYTQEVTEASQNGVFVFLHIMYPGIEQSRLLSALFLRVAPKFRDIKFVDIDARQINDQYRPESCPTILVYHNGQPTKQIVTLDTIGGSSTNMRDIEQLLVTVGAVQDSDRRLLMNGGKDDQDSDSD